MKKLITKIQDLAKGLLNHSVLRNIAMVGGITLAIKGVGFYKETLVASSFGLSVLLDTYFIAFLIPGFISTVFLGAFKNVFIPNYIAESESGNGIASFQGTAFLITGVISLVFMLVAYLGTDVYLEMFFPGNSQEYYALIKSQFYYMMPCILFWGFSALLSGLLVINNEFRYSSFENIFIPVAIIVCLLFFQGALGDMVLAIGTLAGSIASFIFLLAVCIKKDILAISAPDWGNDNARLMLAQVPAKVSSGFLTGMNQVVDQVFAGQLLIGSVAAINYGRKIPAFMTGLLLIALTNVLLPYFSKTLLQNQKKAYGVLFRMLKWLFLGTAIFAIGGILVTDFLVALFFERREFTAEDTQVVSAIQKIFLVYLPFSICGMVLVNFLTSINKNAIMAYVSLVAMLLNIALDYVLMQHYGLMGIAYTTTIVIALKNLFLLGFTYKLWRRIA